MKFGVGVAIVGDVPADDASGPACATPWSAIVRPTTTVAVASSAHARRLMELSSPSGTLWSQIQGCESQTLTARDGAQEVPCWHSVGVSVRAPILEQARSGEDW